MGSAYESYSNGTAECLPHEMGTIPALNTVQGGGVEPMGTMEKKSGSLPNMNAATAFNQKKLNMVDTMGTDEAKSNNKGLKTEKGDHFKVSDVMAMGDSEAKGKSGQSDRR